VNVAVNVSAIHFGTGYSSLSNLLAFPFDRSRSTAPSSGRSRSTDRPPRSCAPCSASAVVGAGGRDRDELNFLANELCSEGQGYLIGKPAGIENFRHLTEAAPDGETRVGEDRALDAIMPIRLQNKSAGAPASTALPGHSAAPRPGKRCRFPCWRMSLIDEPGPLRRECVSCTSPRPTRPCRRTSSCRRCRNRSPSNGGRCSTA